ncbi:MAG TPA: AAA family ATPase [Nannocystis sp.]|jgi:energy-coupling factor transporter ATP-binding protein EcfA2
MTEETPTPTARIKRIEVVGLFGLYDHVIDLNLEDRVTILHGPNGVGKTVLLHMVRSILGSDFEKLAQIPFQRFRVDFTSGEPIDIHVEHKALEMEFPRRARAQQIKTLRNESPSGTYTCNYSPHTSYPPSDPQDDGGLIRQFRETVWLPNRSETALWEDLGDRVPAHLIEAQRILRPLEKAYGIVDTASRLHPAVWGDAIDLQRRIADLLRKYGTVAQDLDQSFPTRLLQRTGQSLPVQVLKSRMVRLEELRAALQSNGILDERRAKPFNVSSLDGLTTAQSDVMALYVEDNEAKLGIFVELFQRVELLLRIVNGRFRNKTLRADHRQGLIVVDHRGQPLELRALSSGEQQQIVLVYDLLFRVPPNTLVLIDEPELSLHVLWQKRFLPDLLEIVKVAGIDALIATHSPFIVGDRSDLMVALDAEIDHDEPLQP